MASYAIDRKISADGSYFTVYRGATADIPSSNLVVGDLFIATDTGRYYRATSSTDWTEFAAGGISDGATIATDETLGSGATYTDLATAGPAVTLVTATRAIVNLSAVAYRTGGGGNTAYVGFEVSGATSLAAADARAAIGASPNASFTFCLAVSIVVTGLTPGTNTFTVKYQNDGGATWHFLNRSIVVSPI